jgi:hypothetical protein
MHSVRRTYRRLRNHFGRTRCNSWVTWVMCNLVSFRYSVSVCARKVHGLGQMHHRLRNHFGCTQLNSLVTWVMWNLVLVHLDIVLVSVQDRCMVCAKRAIGSEINLDAPV